MTLEEVLIQKIEQEKSISFKEFMDMALYYPELGYYNSSNPKIGKEGDFYTSSDVHPLFGMTIGNKISALLKAFEETNNGSTSFKIIEFGAGKGFLAYDILNYLRQDKPDFFDKITYYIIDVSPSLILHQKQTLAPLKLLEGKVVWIKSMLELKEPAVGCIVSNELIDAFPVHRVKQIGTQLKEVFVTFDQTEKKWKELLLDPSTPELADYISWQNIHLEDEQEAEINLSALSWLKEVSSNLAKGFILTIDYGFLAKELYADYRSEGTLVAYHKHQLAPSPYTNIGSQDITAHVNFSALIDEGKNFGLKPIEFTSQSKFLLEAGLLDITSRWYKKPEDILKANLATKTLIMPGGMGDTFKVLVQEK